MKFNHNNFPELKNYIKDSEGGYGCLYDEMQSAMSEDYGRAEFTRMFEAMMGMTEGQNPLEFLQDEDCDEIIAQELVKGLAGLGAFLLEGTLQYINDTYTNNVDETTIPKLKIVENKTDQVGVSRILKSFGEKDDC